MVFSVFIFCRILLFEDTDPGAEALVVIPMGVTLNTSAYVLRGIRLLVMYNPSLRKRYGPYLREAPMVKAMLASYGVLEVIIWCLTLVFGIKRYQTFTPLFQPPSVRRVH